MQTFEQWWANTNNQNYFSTRTADVHVLRSVAFDAYMAGVRHAQDSHAPALEAHYAYPYVGMLCSECGCQMTSVYSDHSQRPFKYIVVCPNQSCRHFELRYRLDPTQGVKLELL